MKGANIVATAAEPPKNWECVQGPSHPCIRISRGGPELLSSSWQKQLQLWWVTNLNHLQNRYVMTSKDSKYHRFLSHFPYPSPGFGQDSEPRRDLICRFWQPVQQWKWPLPCQAARHAFEQGHGSQLEGCFKHMVWLAWDQSCFKYIVCNVGEFFRVLCNPTFPAAIFWKTSLTISSRMDWLDASTNLRDARATFLFPNNVFGLFGLATCQWDISSACDPPKATSGCPMFPIWWCVPRKEICVYHF